MPKAKTRATNANLLLGLVKLVLVVRNQICVTACGLLTAYCLSSEFLLNWTGSRLESWVVNPLAQGPSFFWTATDELIQESRSGVGSQNRVAEWILKLSRLFRLTTEVIGALIAIGTYAAGSTLLRIIAASRDLAMRIRRHETACNRQRLRAYRDVMQSQGTKMFTWELLLWLAITSRHVHDALGDFREEFEEHLKTDGDTRAFAWCRRRIIIEVAFRIRNLFGIYTTTRMVAHFILKHLL